MTLNGVFTAASPATLVTISITCATGGDTRTVTNGRISIIGVNTLFQ